MRKSVICSEKRCMVCGSERNIHQHEVFFGPYRDKSIKDGMVVPLCGYHHNLSSEGVHMNRELDLKLKKMAQAIWESKYGTREEFIRRYGHNYAD